MLMHQLTQAQTSLPTRNQDHVWLKWTLDPNVTHSRQGKSSQPHHQVTLGPPLDVTTSMAHSSTTQGHV
ncbi:hypothetical protein PIB30_111376 [Stylosanthes scabra]|uniref:Uncharacterized protein n=1 Tax=Stylosanthes scabra TaxID=79078 RepID=A0ABU6ZZ40_9FABA|nr:hypothetical protein [Stylosanthes scabra]